MDKRPPAFFSGYSFDGTSISFQRGSLFGLDAAEAHPTAGDWRDVVFSLCSTLQTRYSGLSADNRDDTFVSRTPIQYPSSLGVDAVKRTYSFDFVEFAQLSDPNVVAEQEQEQELVI